MTLKGIDVRPPKNHAELAEIRMLRQYILNASVPESAIFQPTPADLHPSSIHMAAFERFKVVAAVRINPVEDEPGTYLVSRMITRQGYRRKGIGAAVLSAAEVAAKATGATRLILDSRESAEAFYRECGYRRSESAARHFESGIPMEKQLS